MPTDNVKMSTEEASQCCPEADSRQAFITLVRSSLEYDAVVWDPYLARDVDRLEKAFLAFRFILRLSKASPNKDCEKTLIW